MTASVSEHCWGRLWMLLLFRVQDSSHVIGGGGGLLHVLMELLQPHVVKLHHALQ